uniref:t-SNARE coiled-coil homology domain-containing protein n=1 Tax=Heterorhabditis bacteriophora TaxID=37862 RepID=A0A1I7XF84_HETBA
MADFDTELASMALEQERTQQEILRHVQLLHQSMNNLVESMQRQEQKLFELQVATNTVLENTKPTRFPEQYKPSSWDCVKSA